MGGAKKIPRPRGSAEYPFAVRSIFAFGHRCSLLCDEPTTTSRKFILRGKFNLIGRFSKIQKFYMTGRSGPRLHRGTPLLVESCGHTYLDCSPTFCARRVASSSRLVRRLGYYFDVFYVKFSLSSGLAGRNMREEYEIWRNVGLGIAVAGIRGVAGLGGHTRVYGWDWGRWVASLAILEVDGHYFQHGKLAGSAN